MSKLDLDKLKIPAFRRKRSIESRSKKKLLLTAFDRREAGVPIVKPIRKRRRKVVRKVVKTEPTGFFEAPLVDDSFTPPMLDDMPSGSGVSVSELPEVREMRICGECEGYFDKIDVAIVILSGTLRVGDRVVFETSTGLFEQVVESMQINRKNVQIARPGSDIGMKVYIEPRKGGTVYRVT